MRAAWGAVVIVLSLEYFADGLFLEYACVASPGSLKAAGTECAFGAMVFVFEGPLWKCRSASSTQRGLALAPAGPVHSIVSIGSLTFTASHSIEASGNVCLNQPLS